MNALEFVNFVSGQLGYGEHTDVSDLNVDGDKILKMTNMVLSTMHNKGDWPELRTEGRVELDDIRSGEAVAIGGVDVTYGSKTVTSVAQFEATDVGMIIQVGTYTPYYRVAAYVGANEITLDTEWRDEDASTQAWVMARDRYSLPEDMDRILDGKLINLTTGNEVEAVTHAEMREIKLADGLTVVQAEPLHYVVHGYDSSGYKVIHFDRFPTTKDILNYEYQKIHPDLSANTTRILFPEKLLLSLADTVIARLDRDVENSPAAVQAANDAMQGEMRSHQNPDDTRVRMRMRVHGTPHGAYRRK